MAVSNEIIGRYINSSLLVCDVQDGNVLEVYRVIGFIDYELWLLCDDGERMMVDRSKGLGDNLYPVLKNPATMCISDYNDFNFIANCWGSNFRDGKVEFHYADGSVRYSKPEFIGKNLVDFLMNNGYDLYGLVNDGCSEVLV